MKLRRLLLCLSATAMILSADSSWVNWNALYPLSSGYGLQGSMTVMSQSVKVIYTGEWNGMTQYQSETIPYFTNPEYDAYRDVVTTPTNDKMIALQGASYGNKIRFVDSANNPVEIWNPLIAFISLGRGVGFPVTDYAAYTFDSAFDIIDQGYGAYSYGTTPPATTDAPFAGVSDISEDHKTLYGWEWHGIIQFRGKLSEINFDVIKGEFWHGFTVASGEETPYPIINPTYGIVNDPPASETPEPATAGVATLALGALALYRRRCGRA